jgi:hypothetical protein
MKGHEEDMCCFKLKAMQEAQRKTKQKAQQKPKATSCEAFAVEQAGMSEFSDVSVKVNEIHQMQEFLDNMETEVCNHYVILNKSKTQSHTTNLTVLKFELTVVIKSSSFDDKTLKNVLLDTGRTKNLIKVNCLPAKYFEMHQKPIKILWTINSGNFVTNYDIPLTFSLIDFAHSREIEWVVAVDETDSQSCFDMIIGRDLQQAMGMDILFSSQRLRWDGIEVPMQTKNSNSIDLDKMNSTNKNTRDVFAIALSTIEILDAKYEKANLEAYFKLVP